MVRPEANQSGHERWKVLTSIKVAVRSQLNVGKGLNPNPSRPPNIKATALFCGAIHVGQLKFSNASNKKPGPILDFSMPAITRTVQVPNKIQASKDHEISISRERYTPKSELHTTPFLVQTSVQDNCGEILWPDTIIREHQARSSDTGKSITHTLHGK